MSKQLKLSLGLFVLFAPLLPLAPSAAEASTAQPADIKRVVFLGENETKEVDVRALREAADLIQGSRPDLSDEIRKAANIVAG